MRHIKTCGPRFAALFYIVALVVFVASLFVDLRRAAAQIQVYQYFGPSFSYTDCGSVPGYCLSAGNVSGSIVFKNLSANYTGSRLLVQ
jgi:hypothetical protein